MTNQVGFTQHPDWPWLERGLIQVLNWFKSIIQLAVRTVTTPRWKGTRRVPPGSLWKNGSLFCGSLSKRQNHHPLIEDPDRILSWSISGFIAIERYLLNRYQFRGPNTYWNAMIHVDFEHWQYTFPDELLVKYGSPYFSETEAGSAYAHQIFERAQRMDSQDLQFSEMQILAGNEAYPENAVTDPIADLEVWDEWKQGTRYFPYPGRYSKLGITRQEQKTSCPASVGVLGEIMAGFFGQAGVSPWILVRVVRHWPDFIFSHPDLTYSFVESKAFTPNPPGDDGIRARILDGHLNEGAYHAAQQLNSDPFGRVWYCVTQIRSVVPMELGVTMLEFRVSDERRDAQTVRTIPAAVAEGLAERAINQAAAKLELTDINEAVERFKFRGSELRLELSRVARDEVEALLSELGEGSHDRPNLNPVFEAIQKLLNKLKNQKKVNRNPEERAGKRFLAARDAAAAGRLSHLRRTGSNLLFLADLPATDIALTRQVWVPNWKSANQSWGNIGETELWRCGGAVICAGPENLEGSDISRVARGH